MSKNFYIKLILVIGLFIISTSTSKDFAETPVNSQELFKAVNQKRVENNRKPLKWSNALEMDAIKKASEISENLNFNNMTTFKPEEVFFMIESDGLIKNGEVFSIGADTTEHIIKDWIIDKNSTRRFLNKYSKYTGIGVTTKNIEGTNVVIVVQNFGNENVWNIGNTWLTNLFGRYKCL